MKTNNQYHSIRVPGIGEHAIPALVRLIAQKRSGDASHEIRAPAILDRPFELPDGIGRGRVTVGSRHGANGSISFQVCCEAELVDGWLLYEVGLLFEVPDQEWRAVIPTGWGRELREIPLDFEYTGNYPGWSCMAQLMVLQKEQGGITLAVHDPSLELKYLHMRRDQNFIELEVTRVPEFANGKWIVDGSCEVVLGSHQGDWEVAARSYRRLQEAIRPILGRGPRIHPQLKDDPFWLTYNCFAFPSHTPQQASRAIRELRGPTLIHMYNWTPYPFDTRYPELFEDRPALSDEIKRLKAVGAECHPYLNGRVWDTTVHTWKQKGEAISVRDYRNEIETEIYEYSSNIPLAVNCPSQTDHHNLVADSCAGVVERHGLRGVYLDQLGAAYGLRCYADQHGHRPGGAKSWNAGQRELVKNVRDRLEETIGALPFLSIENASEPLVDLIDGFLYYCGRPHEKHGRQVPLWQAIYGDQGQGYADNFGKDYVSPSGGPSASLLEKLARQAVMGVALGWVSPTLVIDSHSAAGKLMRSARAARLPFMDVVRNGLPIPNALDTEGRQGTFMGAWRTDDQTFALAVNPSAEERCFKWPDGKKGQLGTQEAMARRLD